MIPILTTWTCDCNGIVHPKSLICTINHVLYLILWISKYRSSIIDVGRKKDVEGLATVISVLPSCAKTTIVDYLVPKHDEMMLNQLDLAWKSMDIKLQTNVRRMCLR